MPPSESADAISRFVAIPDVSVYIVRTNIGQLPDPATALADPMERAKPHSHIIKAEALITPTKWPNRLSRNRSHSKHRRVWVNAPA